MAKLPGGIFSRPAGKTGNIVFGAARTREGKVATAREYVKPSNPKTPAQQTQRSKFREALAIVRGIGKNIYGSDWNRSISQLAGFQSLMSIIMNNMDDSYSLQAPAVTNLGSLFQPGDWIASVGQATGYIEAQWSTSLGENGTNTDTLVAVAIQKDAAGSPESRDVVVSTTEERQAGDLDLEVNNNGTDYLLALYFRGAGNAAGLISPASWFIVSSAA